MPPKGAASSAPAARWEEAFLTGNGRMGAMLFGDVQNETLVANHCRLFLPLGSREIVPDLSAHLASTRSIIRKDGFQPALAFLLEKASEQGFPGLIPTDPLHPGFFVHVRQKPTGDVREYVRTEDFRSGEVVVQWRDDRLDHPPDWVRNSLWGRRVLPALEVCVVRQDQIGQPGRLVEEG